MLENKGILLLPNNTIKPNGPKIRMVDLDHPVGRIDEFSLVNYSPRNITGFSYADTKEVLAVTMTQGSIWGRSNSVIVIFDLVHSILVSEIDFGKEYIKPLFFKDDPLYLRLIINHAIPSRWGLAVLLLQNENFELAHREHRYFEEGLVLTRAESNFQSETIRCYHSEDGEGQLLTLIDTIGRVWTL